MVNIYNIIIHGFSDEDEEMDRICDDCRFEEE